MSSSPLKLNFTNQDLQKTCDETSARQREQLNQFYLTHSPSWKETIGSEIQAIMSDPLRQNAVRLREDRRAFYYKFHLCSLVVSFKSEFRLVLMKRFIREFNEANGPVFTAEENEIVEDDQSYYSRGIAYPSIGDAAIGICWYLPREQ